MIDILALGVVIMLGIIAVLAKAGPAMTARIMGYPLLFDVSIAALTYVLHMGSFTGVMAATFAGLLASGYSSFYRFMFGYIRGGKFYRGVARRKDPRL